MLQCTEGNGLGSRIQGYQIRTPACKSDLNCLLSFLLSSLTTNNAEGTPKICASDSVTLTRLCLPPATRQKSGESGMNPLYPKFCLVARSAKLSSDETASNDPPTAKGRQKWSTSNSNSPNVHARPVYQCCSQFTSRDNKSSVSWRSGKRPYSGCSSRNSWPPDRRSSLLVGAPERSAPEAQSNLSGDTYAVDCLVQYDFGLIQLLLNGRDTACLCRVLIFIEILPQLCEGNRVVLGVPLCVCCPSVLAEELVEDFGKDRVRGQGWVIFADDHGGDALGSCVAVKHII